MLLHLEINNTLYKIFFIIPIKLSTILSHTKFIRQGPQFSWFFERTTKSSKISSKTKLELLSNSANAMPSFDLLLIYIMSLNNAKHCFFE
jgi:hypothetical protein